MAVTAAIIIPNTNVVVAYDDDDGGMLFHHRVAMSISHGYIVCYSESKIFRQSIFDNIKAADGQPSSSSSLSGFKQVTP